MIAPEVRIRTTQHTVSCIPEDSINHWAILDQARQAMEKAGML